MKQVIISLVMFLSFVQPVMAEITCVDTDGEAVIVKNDIPSAKADAIGRAKWAAVEQVAGVSVKAQSVVQNLTLVDDTISKELQGVVSKCIVISQKNADGILTVKVNACVEPTKAKDVVAGLASNYAISVFIVSKDVSAGHAAHYEESNLLSESLIGKLVDQGYTVVDVVPTQTLDAQIVESAIKSGKFLSLRSLMSKFLTNLLLIGKVEYTVSTKKGADIGYGMSMPFNNVTARLTYRLVTKDTNGNMVILAAGVEQGKGLSGSVEDASAESLKELTEKVMPVILDKVKKNIQDASRKVQIKVSGVKELSENFAIKEILQNTVWVLEVTDTGIGEFEVKYSENPLYLANSLEQKGQFRLIEFSRQVLKLKYAR